MEGTITTNNKPSAWSSFFGSVTGAVESTFKEVLPNWTAKQLNLQSGDQLEKQTFDEAKAPPRVDTIQRPVNVIGPGAMGQTAFSVGGFNVTYLIIAIGFAGLLALGIILRR